MQIVIGIDPGVKTGFAAWDKTVSKYHLIDTVSILKAMEFVKLYKEMNVLQQIRFEDARLRRWYGEAGRERMRGVGSVERDCTIWEEYCRQMEIPFEAIHPRRVQTKRTAAYFKKVTGWPGRTSEHARDAAMIVFGL